MKFKKLKLRHAFFGCIIVVASLFAWGAFESWMHHRYPSTSSFAKYLPENAVATKYEYTSAGLQDFFVEFQATGSRADFNQFVINLLASLPNARIRGQPYSYTNGVPNFSIHSLV